MGVLAVQVLGCIAPVLARVGNIGQHCVVCRWCRCSDHDWRHGRRGECKGHGRRGGCGRGRVRGRVRESNGGSGGSDRSGCGGGSNHSRCVRRRDNRAYGGDSDRRGCHRGGESRGWRRSRASRCRVSERHHLCRWDCRHRWHDRLYWHTLRGLDRWLKHSLWRNRCRRRGRNGFGGLWRWRWRSATGHQCRDDNPRPVPSVAVPEATMKHGEISSASGLLIWFWPIHAADSDAEHTGLAAVRPACHTGFTRYAQP